MEVQPTQLQVVMTRFVAMAIIKVLDAGVEVATGFQRLVSRLPYGQVVRCGGPAYIKKNMQQHTKECRCSHARNCNSQVLLHIKFRAMKSRPRSVLAEVGAHGKTYAQSTWRGGITVDCCPCDRTLSLNPG